MFKNNEAFSGFSVDNLQKAKQFYGETLGMEVNELQSMGLLEIRIANGGRVLIYPKPDHTAASFTVLNFPVKNIDAAVDALTQKGVRFEQYDTEYIKTDAKGIARSDGKGPNVAWFKDPAGNILSVLEQ